MAGAEAAQSPAGQLGGKAADAPMEVEGDAAMEVDRPARIPPPRKLRRRGWWLQPEHLKSPLVMHLEASLLEPIFGRRMCLLKLFEQVNEALVDVRVDNPLGDAEITIIGRPWYQKRAEWLLRAMASSRRQYQAQGVGRLERAMSTLEVRPAKKAPSEDRD